MSSVAGSSGFRFMGGGTSNISGSGGLQKLLDLTRAQTIFYTGDTERMRIGSSGQVKIANGGSLNFDAAGSGNFDIAYTASDNTFNLINNSSSAPLGFNTNSTERMRIDSSGNVNIGSAADAGNTLRYFDVSNANTGASAGSIIRLITSNAAGSGTTSGELIKYKSGLLALVNNEITMAELAGLQAFDTKLIRTPLDPMELFIQELFKTYIETEHNEFDIRAKSVQSIIDVVSEEAIEEAILKIKTIF